MDILKKAEELARKYHNGQERWDGTKYIKHIEAVVNLVNTEDEKIVAPQLCYAITTTL